MKNEGRFTSEEAGGRNRVGEATENIISKKPIQSPSPDRKSSNVICVTRSPPLQEIKKQITPIREEPTALKILQKIESRDKSALA